MRFGSTGEYLEALHHVVVREDSIATPLVGSLQAEIDNLHLIQVRSQKGPRYGAFCLRSLLVAGLFLIEWIGLVFVPRPAQAGDLQSWTGYDLKVLKSGLLEWSLDGQLRVGDSLRDIYDRRIGTHVSVDIGSGVSVGIGYLLRAKDRPDLGHGDWDHRIVAGLKYPILPRLPSLKGTTLYERHVGQSGIGAFNRYRQRFEFDRSQRRVSPLVYQDLTFKREGFVRSRSRVGIRWRWRPGYDIRVAYQFESLRFASGWRPRHAIHTELAIDRTASSERPEGASSTIPGRTACRLEMAR